MADVPRQTAPLRGEAGDWPLFSPRQHSDPDKETDHKDREADERDVLQQARPGKRECSLSQHGFRSPQPNPVRITFMASSKANTIRLITATPKSILTPRKASISA
jgi:hypothetical protein